MADLHAAFLTAAAAMRRITGALLRHLPRAVRRVVLILFFACGLAFLALRHIVAPQVENQRELIEHALAQALGRPVQIGALSVEWPGLRPQLSIDHLRISDGEGRVALDLPEVRASVAWSSLLVWRLQLHRLEIVRPDLALRRAPDGRISVAGLEIEESGGGSNSFGDFVLDQRQIVVRDARLSWTDAQRAAPTLALEHVSLRLENRGSNHRFALAASPPSGYAAALDVRGELVGRDLAKLESWRGRLYLALDEADLAVWKQWVDYPFELNSGRGGVRAWLDFSGSRLAGLDAQLALANVNFRAAADLPQLDLARLQGHLQLALTHDELALQANRLSLATADGLEVAPSVLEARLHRASAGKREGGSLRVAGVELQALRELSRYFPLPGSLQDSLAEAKPEGRVERFAASWAGGDDAPPHFTLDAHLSRFSVAPINGVPGMHGMEVDVRGDERSGQFALSSHGGGLSLPGVLAEPELAFDRFDIGGRWAQEKGADGKEHLTVRLARAQLANAHGALAANGLWQARGEGPGYLDLRIQGRRVQLDAVWRYLPASIPDVNHWLKTSLRGGRGEDVRAQITGELEKFPFEKGGGVFRVDSRVVDGRIDSFAEGWPGLQAIQGSFLMDRARILIRADHARYQNARVRDAKVEFPDVMTTGHEMLIVDGKASGASTDFLHYVNASAVAAMSGDFTRGIRAQGNGELDLHLEIPLNDALHTRVRGSYRLQANTVRLVPELPEFYETTGTLGFSERGVSLSSTEAVFLGRRLRASGVTEADGSLRFDATGVLTAAGLRRLVDLPLWDRLSGETPVSAQIRVKDSGVDIAVDSSLAGLLSELPAPLGKMPAERWNSRFGLHLDTTPGGEDRSSWRLRLDQRLDLAWVELCAKSTACRIQNGAVAIGEPAQLPASGWQISVNQPALDLDRWLPHLEQLLGSLGAGEGAGTDVALSVKVGALTAFSHHFRQVSGQGKRQAAVWNARFAGPDLAGDVEWREAGNGALRARLSQLSLQPVDSGFVPENEASAHQAANARELPALDVEAAHLRLRALDLGQLTLQAASSDGAWLLKDLRLAAPDMALKASGRWQRGTGTQVDFKLDSDDAGKLLARFGQPGAVRGGTVDFSGKLAWRGAPTTLHFPSMTGDLTLRASSGQFLQMEPGAGRLIGILSLQSLPRRMLLDFRDVFSEGFGFDSISGDMKVEAGVLHTRNLEVRGPAARVFITGSTDLAREQHALHMRVQPTLSETVTMGVIVGQAAVGVLNPVVGAAVYLGQKILRDPVEKIFSYDYNVTGPWADPRVERAESRLERLEEKLGNSAPVASAPAVESGHD